MIRRLPTYLTLFAVALALCAAPTAYGQQTGMSADGANTEAKQAAQEAASQWLELTDAGEFGKSWDQGASLLQDQVERAQWAQKGEQVQTQLKELKSREFVQAQFRDSLQQVGNGPFVILQYKSEYGVGPVQEIVFTAKEDDTWKVAGYTVRPMRPQGQGAPPQGGPGQGGGQ